jgi:hypothetical protein
MSMPVPVVPPWCPHARLPPLDKSDEDTWAAVLWKTGDSGNSQTTPLVIRVGLCLRSTRPKVGGLTVNEEKGVLNSL